MLKLPHNYTHFTYSKIMLKILQGKLQQYVNWELPDVQAGFQRGTRDQIAMTDGSWRKEPGDLQSMESQKSRTRLN